jgi:methylamine dehydrogenase accessory protein MauD
MTTALVVSNIVLWLIVIALLLIVFALTRQIGVLHERVAPVGALMPMNGPKIGETLGPIRLQTINGETVTLGPGMTQTFIYFLSPGCPVCKSLLPVVRSFADHEQASVQVLYASDGDTEATHRRYAEDHGIPASRYVLSTELGMALGVNKLPFAALIDNDGVLKARGLVNNREHVESLLTAAEMDVSSLQEYLGIDEEKHES